MARIRTIKPEFWTSEQVASVSRDARLLFVGMWNFADDAGRGKASPRVLRLQVFPGDDDVTAATVAGWLTELEGARLVQLYEADGSQLFSIPGFRKHQRINRPQDSRLPHPPAQPGAAPIRDAALNDDASGAAGACGVTDGREGKGKGRERKGTDTDSERARVATPEPIRVPPQPIPPPVPSPQQPAPQPVPEPVPAPDPDDVVTARLRPQLDEPEHLSAVRVGFAQRFERARRCAYQLAPKHFSAFSRVAIWVAAQSKRDRKDPDAVIAQLLDGFFRDGWAAGAAFPAGALADNPGRYYAPPRKRRGPAQPAAHEDFVADDPDAVWPEVSGG